MKTEQLNYHLPPELIAQEPAGVRSDSRLLFFNRANGELVDSRFSRIGDFLLPGDCLVLNDTKVLPARFFARRSSGGRVEGLFLAEVETGIWEVYLKGARKVKVGESIHLKDKDKGDFCSAEVLARPGVGRCRLKIETDDNLESILEKIGFAPLPPYIKRGDDLALAGMDKVRYQTVYARKGGAVAAPTAGLHFDGDMLEAVRSRGTRIVTVTLHVGPGTFQPVRVADVTRHHMESEAFECRPEATEAVMQTKAAGGRVVAVGTTVVRTLESAWDGERLRPGKGFTNLFVYPGYRFGVVDAVLTNFHLPRSTLLMLVCAFGGTEPVMRAYKEAVNEKYRFYSYGDAMFIE